MTKLIQYDLTTETWWPF